MRDASLPVALVVVGLGWLLWEFRLFPDLDWIIALGFVVGGVLVLVFDGVNRNSVVIGPFLVGIGVAWFLHDRHYLPWRILVPALLVWLGLLMLVARNPRIPDRTPRKSEPERLP